jgi:hypothetical protein
MARIRNIYHKRFATVTISSRSGSPNGRGVAYFLAQHKAQFGGNRFVHQITVFRKDHGTLANILFWIKWAPENPPNPPSPSNPVFDPVVIPPEDPVDTSPGKARVVKRSADGKNVFRERVIRVKK